MQKIKLILTFIGILTLNSCWNNPSEHDLIIGNYYVGWLDMVSNRGIVHKYDSNSYQGIVSSYVYAVGHNSDFIYDVSNRIFYEHLEKQNSHILIH